MTEERTHPHSAPSIRTSKRARARRGLRTGAIVVALIVLIGFTVNQLTPKPYAAVFRVLIDQLAPVKLGPYAARVQDVTERPPVQIPVADAPAAALTIYMPRTQGTVARPLVLLIHGGGWMVGSAKQIGPFASVLASEGFTVASLDYALAPEYTYPTPIRQSAAAIKYLLAHASEYGADPKNIYFAGNSAGSQLASQLGAMVTNPVFESKVGIDIPMPAASLKGIVLYSGPYDFDTVGRDNFPGFGTYAWAYTGVKAYQQYARLDELSTVKNVTSAYPPTYLTAGDADPLEPQSYELDAKLRAKGVNVTSRYWTGSRQGLPHDYIFDLSTQAGQTAFKDVVAFIRANTQR